MGRIFIFFIFCLCLWDSRQRVWGIEKNFNVYDSIKTENSYSQVLKEDAINDLLRSMTLEAFDRFPPPTGGTWKLDEKNFHASDFSKGEVSFVPLMEFVKNFRTILACEIQNITFGQVALYVHNCEFPISGGVPQTVTSSAHIRPDIHVGDSPSYTCVIFFWQPPCKQGDVWILKQAQLF